MLIVFLVSLHAAAMTLCSPTMRNKFNEVPLEGGCEAICTCPVAGVKQFAPRRRGGVKQFAPPQYPRVAD